jgi:hypothetical protein
MKADILKLFSVVKSIARLYSRGFKPFQTFKSLEMNNPAASCGVSDIGYEIYLKDPECFNRGPVPNLAWIPA